MSARLPRWLNLIWYSVCVWLLEWKVVSFILIYKIYISKMIDFSTMSSFDYFLLLSVLLIFLYFYLTKNYGHFDKNRIPYEKPYLLFGSMLELFLKPTSLNDMILRFVYLYIYSVIKYIYINRHAWLARGLWGEWDFIFTLKFRRWAF